MELNVSKNATFTIFNPNDLRFNPMGKCYALISDYDGWGDQYRDKNGYTVVQYDGAPKVYASMREADAAFEHIRKVKGDDHYLFGIYEGGPAGAGDKVHNFFLATPEKISNDYSDGGSW